MIRSEDLEEVSRLSVRVSDAIAPALIEAMTAEGLDCFSAFICIVVPKEKCWVPGKVNASLMGIANITSRDADGQNHIAVVDAFKVLKEGVKLRDSDWTQSGNA